MKFFADECCDTGMVASLRTEGHDVLYILEEEPGLRDELVLQKAYDQRRILLTEDKDFGESSTSGIAGGLKNVNRSKRSKTMGHLKGGGNLPQQA